MIKGLEYIEVASNRRIDGWFVHMDLLFSVMGFTLGEWT
jgi:hypothetical protein